MRNSWNGLRASGQIHFQVCTEPDRYPELCFLLIQPSTSSNAHEKLLVPSPFSAAISDPPAAAASAAT